MRSLTEYRKTAGNKQFCVRRVEVQNSTVVLLLNISNKFSRRASISRPNAKLPDVGGNATNDCADINILAKTNTEHNKICKFAEWKTLYQNQ